jgi:hypothetical protein
MQTSHIDTCLDLHIYIYIHKYAHMHTYLEEGQSQLEVMSLALMDACTSMPLRDWARSLCIYLCACVYIYIHIYAIVHALTLDVLATPGAFGARHLRGVAHRGKDQVPC